MSYQAEILTEKNTIRDLTMRLNRLMEAVQEIDGDKVDGSIKDIEKLKEDVSFIQTNYIRQYPSVVTAKTDTELREGMLVRTMGYYSANDGGASIYVVAKTTADHVADGGSIIPINDELHLRSISTEPVNYKQFGAEGIRSKDDGPYIKRAHEYANLVGLPVHNPHGEYYIKSERMIPVRTNTNLGQTVIYIDESQTPNSQGHAYVIMSDYGQKPLSSSELTSIKPNLKKGTRFISELVKYAGSFVKVFDSTTKVGNRVDGNAASGWDMQDCFVVEEGGRIVGDITWDFNNVTSGLVRKLDKNYLTFEGGVFQLSGNLQSDDYGSYKSSGILVQRSRTIIKNQFVGLSEGAAGSPTASDSGFYNLESVYDVTIENIRAIPRRFLSVNSVYIPSYGIGGTMALNCTLRNISSEGTSAHWSVAGANVFKNTIIENSTFNGIDFKFHIWDLYLKNCEIGQRGLSLSGGGKLSIENTTVYSSEFVSFQRDYGSRWNGDIRIKESRLVPDARTISSLLKFNPSSTDYGYDVVLGRSITVEDFLIDVTGVDNSELFYLFNHNNQRTTGARSVFMPSYMSFKDVRVRGRSRGVRLFNTLTPIGYRTHMGNHVYEVSPDSLVPNAEYRFENIDTENIISDPQSVTDTHLYFIMATGATYSSSDLAPLIEIRNCKYLHLQPKNSRVKMVLRDSEVRAIDGRGSGLSQGVYHLHDCDIAPNLSTGSNASLAYKLEGAKVNLSGCHFHVVKYNNLENTTKAKLDLLYFFTITASGLQVQLKSSNSGNTVSKKLSDAIKSAYSEYTLEAVVNGLSSNSLEGVETKTKGVERYTDKPNEGTWKAGDIVRNAEPVPATASAWICTKSGSPGTWNSLGDIATKDGMLRAATYLYFGKGKDHQDIGPKGAIYKVPFNHVTFDSHNVFNLSNSTMTIPIDGMYTIDARVLFYTQISSNTDGYQNFEISLYNERFPLKRMKVIAHLRDYLPKNYNQSVGGSVTVPLLAGDVISIQMYCGGYAAWYNSDNAENFSYWHLTRIGPLE